MHGQVAANAAANPAIAGRSVGLGLGRQASGQLTALSSLHHKAPGETLFAEGEDADSIYEVVRGMVRIHKLLPDGRRQITGFLSAGQLLGLAPEGVFVYTAEAITEVTLCRYKRAAFERLIEEVPGFAKRLIAVTSQELYRAQDQMLLLGRKSATEKVASFLLLMTDPEGRTGEDEVQVPMTRSDIADYLGLTIETVSRTLSKLKQEGIIALPTPAHIEIRERGRLEELAAGEASEE